MSAYQISCPMSNLPQDVKMMTTTGPLPNHLKSSVYSSQQQDEAIRKREIRLKKNRLAAKECRQRKKQYLQCLEERIYMLEIQNKQLMAEVQYMKGIFDTKSC